MAIEINWYNLEKTIMMIRFHKRWKWGEIYEMSSRTDALLDTVEHKVDFIVDISHVPSLNLGMNMQRLRDIIKHYHPNANGTVICGVVPSILPVLKTLIRATRSEHILSLAKDEAQALAILIARQVQNTAKTTPLSEKQGTLGQ